MEERGAAIEDLRKFSPEDMKIVPYQPNRIWIGQEEQGYFLFLSLSSV